MGLAYLQWTNSVQRGGDGGGLLKIKNEQEVEFAIYSKSVQLEHSHPIDRRLSGGSGAGW